MWDACEALLKASLQPKEDVLLAAWVRGWTQSLAPSCFPRLHVITAEASIPRARAHFSGVPNVTYRDNAFPPLVARDTYRLIQIHILWADNFTAAPYLLYFDTDAVPVLPLRCHHLFDDDERLLIHAWNRGCVQPPPSQWFNPPSLPPRRAAPPPRVEPQAQRDDGVGAPDVRPPPLGARPMGRGSQDRVHAAPAAERLHVLLAP